MPEQRAQAARTPEQIERARASPLWHQRKHDGAAAEPEINELIAQGALDETG
jgi:hypothetical protein